MLGCCSNTCPRRKECKRNISCAEPDFFFSEVVTLESLDTFGSAQTGSAGFLSIDYACGKLGDYKLYIPLEENA